jgi:hypothetical protein
VSGGFCVVSGKDVMLDMEMSIADSSYMLTMMAVKAMAATANLDGTLDFVACCWPKLGLVV